VRECHGGRCIRVSSSRVCDQYLQLYVKSALAGGVFRCVHGTGVYVCLCSVCVCIICASVCKKAHWWQVCLCVREVCVCVCMCVVYVCVWYGQLGV